MSRTRADLIEAAQNGDLPTVKKCLEAGVNIDVPSQDSQYGQNALHSAAREGHLGVVQYLIASGAKTDVRDSRDQTPLDLARDYEQNEVIAYLELAERLQTTPEWSLLGSFCLAHVESSIGLQRQLTEVFNFASRERLLISENLKTGSETVLPPTGFDDLPQALLEKALEQLKHLGGAADEEFVLHGTGKLNKPKRGL